MYFDVNDNHEVIRLENVERLMEDIPNKIVITMGIVVDVIFHEQFCKRCHQRCHQRIN